MTGNRVAPVTSAQPDLAANHEGDSPARLPYVLLAFRIAESHHWDMSGSRIRKLIREYLAMERTGELRDFRSWFIVHADPTGEAAVRRVMRDGGDGSV